MMFALSRELKDYCECIYEIPRSKHLSWATVRGVGSLTRCDVLSTQVRHQMGSGGAQGGVPRYFRITRNTALLLANGVNKVGQYVQASVYSKVRILLQIRS